MLLQVIQPYIAVDLSFRTAPGTDEKKAAAELKTLLEANPPYGAKVIFRRPLNFVVRRSPLALNKASLDARRSRSLPVKLPPTSWHLFPSRGSIMQWTLGPRASMASHA
jgi:hypothetical protein